MRIINKSRTLRQLPSREPTSLSYRIHTDGIKIDDVLYVNVYNKSKPNFVQTYKINGSDIAGRKSIHLRVNDNIDPTEFSWTCKAELII